MNRTDVHHVYPRNHLKKQGLSRGRYNQIANVVLAQSEINIAVGDKSPQVYFSELSEQCAGGPRHAAGRPPFAPSLTSLRSRPHAEPTPSRKAILSQRIPGKSPETDRPKSSCFPRPGLVPQMLSLGCSYREHQQHAEARLTAMRHRVRIAGTGARSV
jgi:hypothetical protein